MSCLSTRLYCLQHCQGAWCKRIACLEKPCIRQAIHIADHPKCPPSLNCLIIYFSSQTLQLKVGSGYQTVIIRLVTDDQPALAVLDEVEICSNTCMAVITVHARTLLRQVLSTKSVLVGKAGKIWLLILYSMLVAEGFTESVSGV